MRRGSARFRYGPGPSQVAELHLPQSRPCPVVVLVHGGFWRVPYGRPLMAPLARGLAARGFAAWNIGYRRVGERGGGWPGTFADAAAAVDALADLAREHGLDLDRVASVGHSAGGHLALWTAARPGLPDGAPGAPSRSWGGGPRRCRRVGAGPLVRVSAAVALAASPTSPPLTRRLSALAPARTCSAAARRAFLSGLPWPRRSHGCRWASLNCWFTAMPTAMCRSARAAPTHRRHRLRGMWPSWSSSRAWATSSRSTLTTPHGRRSRSACRSCCAGRVLTSRLRGSRGRAAGARPACSGGRARRRRSRAGDRRWRRSPARSAGGRPR